MTRCLAGGVALMCALGASPRAFADDSRGAPIDSKSAAKDDKAAPAPRPPADVKKADALFQKARLLKKLGKEAEACGLFLESQALDPNGGTLVNIADCHDAEGKTGTAWRELMSALKLAKQTEDKDLIKGIREKLIAIIPRIYQITVQIPGDVMDIEGVEIRIDDKKLTADVPSHFEVVDPGKHTVHASAPGHIDFDETVTLEGEQRSASVRVSLPKPAPPPPPDHTTANGLIVGGSAGVVLGGGLLVGSVFTSDWTQVGLAVGGGAAAVLGLGFGITGLALRWSAPAPSTPTNVTRRSTPQVRLAVQPVLAPGSAFLGVSGVF